MTDVFYLKYRPQKINELDLKDIREQLTQLLGSKSMPHALLFSGPKGLGKTSAARIVAKAINCPKKKGVEPCNKCEICQSITNATAFDLIEIDAASNRGIDDIRELRERIKLTPSQAEKKVYVIDEVHMLTKEAFNALLKTLEEPPNHAFFVLCTTEPEKLPETIISRCQRLNFSLANPDEIVRSLKRIVKGEKLKVSNKILDLISRKSEGSFRDATKVLQQLAFKSKNISLKQTVDLLEKETIFSKDILAALAKNDTNLSLKKLEQAVKQGADLKTLTQTILEDLRNILLSQYGILSEQKKEDKKQADHNLTKDKIKQLILVFDQAARQLKGAVIPQLPLELAIVQFGEKKAADVQESKREKEKLEVVEEKTITKPLTKTTEGKSDVNNQWQQVLEVIKKDNHSVEALLKSTRFKGKKGNKIVVEVFYEFHKNKLESKTNTILVEKRISEIFNLPLKVEYILKTSKT